MRVSVSASALADLRQIRAYIGSDNPEAASRIAIQLVAAMDRLEYLPERGRPGQEPGTRELVVLGTYIIVYRITENLVTILRVWHAAQER